MKIIAFFFFGLFCSNSQRPNSQILNYIEWFSIYYSVWASCGVWVNGDSWLHIQRFSFGEVKIGSCIRMFIKCPLRGGPAVGNPTLGEILLVTRLLKLSSVLRSPRGLVTMQIPV